MSGYDAAILIPMAFGVSLSPVALIELILVLFSKRRGLNSVIFVIALAVMMSLGLWLGSLGSVATGSTTDKPSIWAALVMGLLGVFLVVFGVSNWLKRKDTSEPKMFQAIGNMGPFAVAFLSVGATFLNPKNLPLLLGAGEAVGVTAVPLLSGAVFVLCATSPYWAAMLFSLFGGETAKRVLDKSRLWLIRRNRIIMAWLCGVLGLLMVVSNLVKLFG